MASVNTTSFKSRLLGLLGRSIISDNSALFGLLGALDNTNASLNMGIVAIPTSGTAVTVPTTAFPARTWDLGAGASGGFTLTLPTTAAIIAAYPNTIPADGQFVTEIDILNDAVGQTATLTAGDASTTVLGTATIATNTTRTYAVQINVNNKTINFMNKGTKNL